MTVSRARVLELVLIAAALVAADVLVIGAALKIGRGGFGDFSHFYYAAQAVRAGDDMYASGEGGYIYPPLLAVLFQPLTGLAKPDAALCWLAINAALLVAGTMLASRHAVRCFDVRRARWPVALIAALAVLLTLDKTRATLNQGQTDSLMILGFVLGLVWLERRPVLAGLAIGFAANIKYLSLVTIPYLIVRRRWSAAAWAAASTVAWALLPAVSLGWSENLRALSKAFSGLLGALGVSVQAGAANINAEDWHLSLSVTSAISRLLGPGASPLLKAAGTITVALGVLGAARAVYSTRGRSLFSGDKEAPNDHDGAATTALEWAGLIVAALAFGPQTTGRHLVLLLAVHPFAAAILLGPGAGRRKVPLVVGTVILQLAMVLPPGGRMFEGTLDAWRAVGGASWCMLAMYLAMLWVGLPGIAPRSASSAHQESPLNPASARDIERIGRASTVRSPR